MHRQGAISLQLTHVLAMTSLAWHDTDLTEQDSIPCWSSAHQISSLLTCPAACLPCSCPHHCQGLAGHHKEGNWCKAALAAHGAARQRPHTMHLSPSTHQLHASAGAAADTETLDIAVPALQLLRPAALLLPT